MTPLFEWTALSATFKDGLLFHVKVRVRATAPDGMTGDFYGEVELPAPEPGQTIVDTKDINSDTLLRWAKAANGSGNNDIWQGLATHMLQENLESSATFYPSDSAEPIT